MTRSAPAYSNLGMALRRMGRLEDAEAALRRAVALAPNLFEAHLNLGGVLSLGRGSPEESRAACARALELNPNSAEAHYNMGNALLRVPDFEGALTHFDQAIAFDPSHDEALNNRAKPLVALGRIGEARDSLIQAVTLDPTYPAWNSNLVFHRHYDPAETPMSLFAAARNWDAAFSPSTEASLQIADTNPNRRLRVGYVGAHLSRHPVGYFLQPVVAAHDAQSIEAVCYAKQISADELTDQLHAHSAAWYPVANDSDMTLLERIRSDRIDILVDLDGHTSGNRLAVFARRAAPVQVTWAGYVGTTGVKAMDYLITDRRETPDSDLPLMTEQPVYMPGNYVTVEPLSDAPDVLLRHADDGGVTFGCFNNLNKVNDGVIALWSEILAAVPDSKLCLITEHLADRSVLARIIGAFSARGIPAVRLDLRGKLPRSELLAAYNSIDIALDPFPYSGGLTTLEALWMGTPVITRGDGDRFAGRHSVTHLTAVDVPELIATDATDYVARAVALAQDAARRQLYHQTLRDKMRASPACDGAGFTRNLEKAFRIMWQRACAGEVPSPIPETLLSAP
jgi:protein O-GlcNAc transferase